MFKLKNIYFRYKNRLIFENLNFEVSENKFIGISGKNGVGKTSLLKLILGVERPLSGDVSYTNSSVKKAHFFGSLIENPPLIEFMTVFENLNYKRHLLGINSMMVENVINNCQLSSYKYIKAKDLSLGNKQKLGIALAIINNPRLLILDEPTNSIDESTSIEILDLLADYRKSTRSSVVIVSHDRNLMNLYCDEIYEIESYELIKRL